MDKQIYDSGAMSVSGNRDRVIVTRVSGSIEVTTESLYDRATRIEVYRAGNHPALPADWSAMRNADTTEAQAWLHELGGHAPDRVINPAARAMGQARSAAKSAAARANGARGGRPRKSQ